jgi:hypothetical protein
LFFRVGNPLRYNTGLKYNTKGQVYGGSLPDVLNLNKRKTMSLTITEVFGFADKVGAALDSNSTELAAKGLTVTPWKAEGAALKDAAVQQGVLEGKAKSALKDQSTAFQGALQTVYDYYSTKLDAAAGVYGKTTTKGKELLRLRSDIRRGPNDPGTTPAASKS